MAKVRSSRSSRKRLPLVRSLFSLLFSLLLGGVLLGAALTAAYAGVVARLDAAKTAKVD